MDEFSDFQMAVQMPAPNASKGIPPPIFSNHRMVQPPHGTKSSSSGLRFSSDSSPVHSIASHTSKSDLVHSQLSANQSGFSSCSPAINKVGASVGSRLANYDLGFSGPQTQTNGFQSHQDFSLTASASANFPKTINNLTNHHQQQPSLPIQRSNQDLLIGEEDKYSALRMLIETDVSSSSCSVFESSAINSTATQNVTNGEESKPKPVQPSSNHVSNGLSSTNSVASSSILFDLKASPIVNSNTPTVVQSNNHMGAFKFPSGNTSAAETSLPSTDLNEASSAGGDFSDFGDFQSFTGFTSASTTPSFVPPNTNSSTFPVTNTAFMGNFQSQSIHVASPQLPNFTPPQKQVAFDLTRTQAAPLQNGNYASDDGDTEFGDFVSVEPVPAPVQQSKLPPVPAPAPLPTFSSWNKHLDLSTLTLVKQTPPPLPPVSHEDKENIEDIMDIGGYFSKFASPLENDLSRPLPKPEQQPLPPTQETCDDDDFDAFTSYTSSSNCNNVTSVNDSDQGKIADCSVSKANQANFPNPSSASSTFIRTSLIRNDKVTDIDPMKWNQSVDDSNNELDYSSLERKDFALSGIGKSKFLDVSPETRSIASLDLGNYVSVDYSESGTASNNISHNNNNNTIYNPATPSQNHQQSNGFKSGSSLVSGTSSFPKGGIPAEEPIIYDEYDKYQCFREECENEKERHYSEWTRCLLRCKEMVSSAFSVFNGVSTSEVLREVVADEKGYSYVMNILEIYRVSLRIKKSATKLGVQSKLESITTEITNLWESLSAFLFGTCVSTEVSQENVDHDDCCADDSSSAEDAFPSCGVCLCSVNTSESSQFLDYGGKIYHCKCANFWVNEVDAILPSLSNVSNIVANSKSTSPTATSVTSFHGSRVTQSKLNRTNSLV